MKTYFFSKKQTFPMRIMALAFAAVIAIGAFLLHLPISNAPGQQLSWIDAVFTATSATCVTGLSVINVGEQLSMTGQIILVSLIQLGGLGITTFSTFILILAGKRLSMQNEFSMMDAYGLKKVNGVKPLICWTVALTFFIELLCACSLLNCYLHPVNGQAYPMEKAVFYSIFHSVSIFCHAGFSLHHDSFVSFVNDWRFLRTVDATVAVSSLGFIVLYNLLTIKWWKINRMERGKLTLHSKLALITTVIITATGLIGYTLLEWNNAFAQMGISEKLSCGLSMSLTTRTPGFNLILADAMSEGSRVLMMLQMFIGGSPSSPAGGLKTTTAAILVMTVIALCRNSNGTIVAKKTIPGRLVREAIVIFVMMGSLVFITYFLLACTEAPMHADSSSRYLFEAISAASTCGLSLDMTPKLSEAGRILVSLCMYLGRLGPITVVMAISSKLESSHICYPEEDVVVG